MTPPSAINWNAVEAAYVEGLVDEHTGERVWHSLRQLARFFQINDNHVRQKSNKRGWVAKRETFRTNLDRERQRARVKNLSEAALTLDTVASTAAETGLKLIQHRQAEITREVARRREAGEADSAIDALEAAHLARAAHTWYALGALALGKIPTQRVEHIGTVEVQEPFDRELRRLVREMKEREAAEMEAERLDLERVMPVSPNGDHPNGERPSE